jgi:hypothetical protein
VIIYLHCMEKPAGDFSARLDAASYGAWEETLRKVPAGPSKAAEDPGPGAQVLCSNARAAVESAGRLFKDRRIEVKPEYGDPLLNPPALGLRLKPAGWRFLARLSFFLGWGKNPESPDAVRARMVALATKLIGLAKQEKEAHFVGEPFMIRLLALKLMSIGYHGPMLRPIRYGKSYAFEYEFK